ncbi:MAG: hypothetical protein HKO59_17640 [Phycisphaerales bacterium]|nr:hypothetical protein [Phycisphaerae bacterium]NNM27766.1 hypothetical protein [Phycisphaerales bacterium]
MTRFWVQRVKRLNVGPADRVSRAGRMVAVLLLAATTAAGQDPPLPLPPVGAAPGWRPTLVGRAYTTTLTDEIDLFADQERTADDRRRTILRASINCRIIAAELIDVGVAAGEPGVGTVQAGLRVAHAREDLDRLFRRVLRGVTRSPPHPAAATAWDNIVAFNERAIDHASALRTTDVATLDATLAEIFAALAAVLADLGEPPLPPAWPAPGLAATAADGTGLFDAIDNRIDRVALPEATQQRLRRITDFLARGRRFPELNDAVAAGVRRVTEILDVAESIAAAEDVPESLDTRLVARVEHATIAYLDPATRSEGERAIDELLALDRLRSGIVRLHDAAGNGRPLFAVLTAMEAAEGPHGARFETLRDVVDRMQRLHRIERRGLPTALGRTVARLVQTARRTEDDLLAAMDRLVDDPAARTDPGFASLLTAQRRELELLEQSTALPARVDRLRDLDPVAAAALERPMRRIMQGLGRGGGTPESVAAVTTLVAELERFAPLPFEDELASRSTAAISATGGRADDLLTLARHTRRVWAERWTDDPDARPPEARQLETLHRLLAMLADVGRRPATDADVALLERWGGWELPAPFMRRVIGDVPARLKLACAAALDDTDDPARLAHELEAIGRVGSLAAVIGRLGVSPLARAWDRVPDSTATRLATLVKPPSTEAWFVDLRGELAMLGVAALEADVARSISDTEAAEAAEVVVREQAATLLERLDPSTGVENATGSEYALPAPAPDASADSPP